MHKQNVSKLHIDERCEYRLRRGLPWLFDKYCDFGRSPVPAVGDLVAVYGRRNQCVGVGLYDPYSPVRVRMLGAPCEFGRELIAARIACALARRAEAHIVDADTNALRLLSGESEGLPGLVIDGYADTWVLKVYASCWLPYLSDVIEILSSYRAEDSMPFGVSPTRMVLRFGRECRPVYEKAGYVEASVAVWGGETPYSVFL